VADDLTAVVVTHNSAAVVAGLLDSLPAALAGIPAEVVVVDNGSTDGTAALLEARGGCRVVRSANVGYAAGINRGVRESRAGGDILVLNPDVRLAPGAVGHLVAAAGLPRTGIVAPRIRDPDGTLALSLRRDPSLPRALGLNRTGRPLLAEYVTEPAAYERAGVVDWALGAVLLVTRECHDALGGWDESYFLYSEETDLSLRARDRGLLTRYEPAAVAVHLGGGSGRSGRTQAMQAVNRVRLYRRRHGPAAAAAYLALTVAAELSWAARGNRDCRAAAHALLRPSRRPAELNAPRLLPR
jgi:GT2 family glycosyltransferase